MDIVNKNNIINNICKSRLTKLLSSINEAMFPDIYKSIVNIKLVYNNFEKYMESLNTVLPIVEKYKNENNNDKIETYKRSLEIYFDNMIYSINNIIYIIKKLFMTYNIETFGEEYNIIKDYNFSFSSGSLNSYCKEFDVEDITKTNVSCVQLMRTIYNNCYDYVF